MGATLMLMRNPTAARPSLLLLLLPRHATTARPVLLLLLPRHATEARLVLLQLLLPQHATVARPVLLQLLLPRHATVAVAAAAAEACRHREIPYRRICRRPFVGLRTSYTALTCLLLLELAALQLNRHAALQSSPQIALASLPSGHLHPPYLKLIPLTHTPGFMPPARQDLRHTCANGIYATRV